MISPGNKYLVAVLNSKVGDYYIRSLGVTRSGGYFEYKPMFVEQLPVPQLLQEKQTPFEILVDCILFAREKNMEQESFLLESVVDGLVYDLYFPDEMKAAHCYITDQITEVLKPFRQNDSDSFKSEYVKSLYTFCNSDPVIYHGLIHRRTVKPDQIISGAEK
jgi:adenine-specific DNA-methyltransferase